MRQPLSDAIGAYMSFRQSQDFSKGTLRNDRSILTRFLAVAGNIQTHSLRDTHVIRYFEEAGKTRTPNSLRNDNQTLRAFFEWCRSTKRMDKDADPMHGRRLPKLRKRERYRIHVSKFPHLLDLAGERDPRDRALVAVLLYTLMRDQEVASLRIGDVDLDAGYIRAQIHKSGIEDRLPISAELDRELRAWLTHYAEAVGQLHEHHYLIPSRQSVQILRDDDGRNIAGHVFSYVPSRKVGASMGISVRPLLERLGVPLEDEDGKRNGEGCHTLRRSGARALFDQLWESIRNDPDLSYAVDPLRVVQAMLHHQTQATTEIYLGITADKRTRDDLLRGKVMYPAVDGGNVLSIAR